MTYVIRVGLLVALSTLALPAVAAAKPPEPSPYQQDDYADGRAFNIVPPGQNGSESFSDIVKFLGNGTRPPHQYDQNDMYANLVYATPGLQESQILDYFKDGSFGVPSDQVEDLQRPNCVVTVEPSADSQHCRDVTIQRDNYGVPHIYGEDRAALMFGIGYATGQDRLFLADAMRHAGRADLSTFAGGANVAQDRDTFMNAPYAGDEELQTQLDLADDLYGQRGAQMQADAQNYVDGINQWIAETRLNPAKLDALYSLTGHLDGPEPWTATDVIATGALVAGIFGKGGGEELDATTSLQDAKQVLGSEQGKLVWKDFRSADDPDAPRTVHKQKFPYRTPPKGKARGLAMPDRGSVQSVGVVAETSSEEDAQRDRAAALLDGLDEITAGSNALVVSAQESETGHPLAVFGPQTGYYAPQLLFEQDIHAPGGPEGPAIDARGVAFAGTNLYVQLGRGQDYSFSATSSGHDIIDTFAVKLCDPSGGTPTRSSTYYEFDGECQPMDVLTHTNTWEPNAADSTPAGSETLRMYRTKAGLVTATATIDGKPYAYTKLRATYKHEVDSAISYSDWNSPEVVKDAESWTKAGYTNDMTFNWFYVDDEHIAYYNSGADPVRAKDTHPNFPVLAKRKFMWRNYDPVLNTFKRNPIDKHAQVIDQRFLTSWNNKQAKGYRCDGIRCFTSVYRVDSLDEKIEQEIKGDRKMSLTELIDAMESAGTTDLRGLVVVPYALKVIAKKPIDDPDLQATIDTMRAWVDSGAHRIDHDNDGAYDQADAVRIMDAWWPLWVKAQFEPTLGSELYADFIGEGDAIHDEPGPVGSAFQNNVYGFVQKDLRSLLGDDEVKAPYSRLYCGEGKLGACRKLLLSTLQQAAATSFDAEYGTEGCELNNGTMASAQMCVDAVNPTDLTGMPVEEFHWINRPTFQQAVEYQRHR